MRTSLVMISAVAGTLCWAGLVSAEDQVQQRTTTTSTQQTYQAPNSAADAPTAQAPGSPQVSASTPAASGALSAVPVTERTYTREEVILAQTNPPIRWSVLQGEVTHVDKVNNVVEIRLKGSDSHVGIPVVERKVGIYKHGDHQYALRDIEPGDDVTIRNLNTAGG